MYKIVSIGDKSITEPAKLPVDTLKLLREIHEQNRLILECNLAAISMITAIPSVHVVPQDDK